MNLRNIYAAVIMALTGYIFSKFSDVSKSILYTAGFINIAFILNYIQINAKIDRVKMFDYGAFAFAFAFGMMLLFTIVSCKVTADAVKDD